MLLLSLPVYGDTLETTDIDALLAEATEGDAIAQFNLGMAYAYPLDYENVEPDFEKAVEWFTKAADQGHVDAQFYLGQCYRAGNGVEPDFEKAVEWYTKAADQGHAPAQSILGVCYEMGNGVAKDLEKAVEWYTKAADQGYASAQYSLGLCYENGKGVAIDKEKALEWYTKAVESAKPGPYVQAQTRMNKLQASLK
ncbi:MAG: sel1 repeat family protein [Methanomicrobiales archaeon]|nr:sel1 repeat family protein [Methanomicrobiales archaeon]